MPKNSARPRCRKKSKRVSVLSSSSSFVIAKPIGQSLAPFACRHHAENQSLEIFALQALGRRVFEIGEQIVDFVFLFRSLRRYFYFFAGVSHTVEDFLNADHFRIATEYKLILLG